MRLLTGLVIGGLLLAVPGGAGALQGAAGGHCEGDQHVVAISGLYFPDFDGEITGLEFVRETIGVCRAPETVPDEPLPFAPEQGVEGWEYSVSVALPAPADAATFRYTPYAVRPDGGREVLHALCDADDRSYVLIACDDVPLARGTLDIDWPNLATCGICFRITNCRDDCWAEHLSVYIDDGAVYALSGLHWTELMGRTVDVFGDRTWCAMLGGDYHVLTSIAPTVGDACGSVPTAETTWSEWKARYR